MEKLPCSVPILTLNRVEELKRMLPMLVERFDDVFLVDGNSSDGTREYARSLSVRVEPQVEGETSERPIEDFAAMRHRSWGMARYPWIFWIDSDEVPTQALLDRVVEAVQQNDPNRAYRFVRVPQLPDGRIVEQGFYFPEYILRLFHRDAGLRLVDRRVHEKFIVPDHVKVIDCEERLLAPWPTPKVMWPRQRDYIDLDAQETNPTWEYLIRWIWIYNIRSLIGQLLRAVRSSWNGYQRKQVALPWSYNWLFFKYRLMRLALGTREWLVRRYRVT